MRRAKSSCFNFRSAGRLAQRALTLSRQERARLAEELLASLNERPDPGIEAAWAAEIRRRIDEIEFGKAKLVSADEVFDEIRKMLK